MANRGYDVVVDVDAEGDLGHTDLQEDLEFHSSNFDDQNANKIPADNTPFLSSSTNPANLPSSSAGPSSTSKRYLWSLSFYAQYFDVDTSTVLTRCMSTLFPRLNFLDILDGNPDLYGPFWIATTVVVILFLTGTISQYLARHGEEHFSYDFRLLSGAAGLIYGYTGFVPLALWGVLRWFGSQGADVVECWSLYGYSNLVWIAVALLSWSPIGWLNFLVVGLGFGASVAFLVRNLYPVLSATEKKTSQILLVAVILLHAGLAIAIRVLFFAHGSPASKKDKDDKSDSHDKLRRFLMG